MFIPVFWITSKQEVDTKGGSVRKWTKKQNPSSRICAYVTSPRSMQLCRWMHAEAGQHICRPFSIPFNDNQIGFLVLVDQQIPVKTDSPSFRSHLRLLNGRRRITLFGLLTGHYSHQMIKSNYLFCSSWLFLLSWDFDLIQKIKSYLVYFVFDVNKESVKGYISCLCFINCSLKYLQYVPVFWI